ncbi:acyl-coenzyme A oxidase 3 [Capsaspora owczarzaki ATCC 30864]|uniref:Acyl-coenzyme A oxidase n=1 Tax=Capsaspora owczarzaki (strain ATCC 30864) TaxID=595528 RepID=A0A0D2WJ11_CAPO3|nr:acyl-coenzyme A oxidase 3 [Capsaspora owczarzaki ATCC 30864]KJE89168.1 acyl-coenzyme A oxidase 3 [Capsaspora owczarzaki ATCC 30864]|eukprot:XP_004365565.1 acyl-coenzyme A oxidase 3 [Capsaspora owczarzaki ATCC 30864]
MQRLNELAVHLSLHPEAAAGAAPSTTAHGTYHSAPSATSNSSTVSIDLLNKFVDKHNFATRKAMWELLKEPLFELDYNMSIKQLRDLTLRRLQRLSDLGYPYQMLDPNSTPESQMEVYARTDCMYMYDCNLTVRVGAHVNLWGGSVRNLGTEYHHEKYLKDIAYNRLPGCFAMTELGHGSNVKGLETTATFDKATQEFIINTPTESAQKFWIGNALTAHAATVFAQLHIGGVNRGIHAFIVPLRDANGKIPHNIRIADCGMKMGLNGVDNGRFWFNNVRIPRMNMLNRMANVTEDGEYLSMIEDNDMRFGAMVAELVAGRVSMIGGSTNLAKVGLTIAVLYSIARRQFGPDDSPERPIMDYLLHQRRLVPEIAGVYAMNATSHYVRNLWVNRSADFDERIRQMKEIHILASGLKALSGWQMRQALSTCREACGGQGYASWNRIPVLMADSDVFMTFEGDNNVLLVQVARQLVKEYARAMEKGQAGIPQFAKPTDRLAHMAGTARGVPLSAAKPVVWDASAQRFVEVNLSAFDNGSKHRNAEFQMRIFEIREYDAIKRLIAALSAKKAAGHNDDSAWNLCGELAAVCGQAYIERFVLTRFIEDIQTESSAPERLVLEKLRALHAMWRITTQPSFLAYQFIPRQDIEIMADEVNVILAELRPHLANLVKAFGVPQHLLPAITSDYVAAHSWAETLKASEFKGNVFHL